MSGEASWTTATRMFSLTILSGQPVWHASEGTAVAKRLEQDHAAHIPAIEAVVEAARVDLSLRDYDPRAISPARVYLTGRESGGGLGFNLVLTAAAPPPRALLEALARRVADVLWGSGGTVTVR